MTSRLDLRVRARWESVRRVIDTDPGRALAWCAGMFALTSAGFTVWAHAAGP